jgi:hypothetical protein
LALNSRHCMLIRPHDPWRVRWRIARGVRAVPRRRTSTRHTIRGASLPPVLVPRHTPWEGGLRQTCAQTSRLVDRILMARRLRSAHSATQGACASPRPCRPFSSRHSPVAGAGGRTRPQTDVARTNFLIARVLPPDATSARIAGSGRVIWCGRNQISSIS